MDGKGQCPTLPEATQPQGKISPQSNLTDAQLLSRYSRERDEIAFATIVRRHGPMVLGVCRRILHDPHAAEDAFQATFLVLVRKAGAVGQPERLSNWLYGVAYKVATRFRRQRDRAAPIHEQNGKSPDPVDEVITGELQHILDDEIHRLPQSYRLPLILCCFEGKTYEDAAEMLNCSEGTVKSRLSRARARLQQRLRRHGWTVATSVLVSLLSPEHLKADVPVWLLDKTCSAANSIQSGNAIIDAHTTRLLQMGNSRHVLRWLSMAAVATAVLMILGFGMLYVVSLSSEGPANVTSSSAPSDRPEPMDIEIHPAPPVGAPLLVAACWPNVIAVDQRIKMVAMSPRGVYVALVLEDGSVDVFNGIQQTKKLHIDKKQGPWVSAAFSPNEKTLAVVSAEDNRVHLFDYRKGVEIHLPKKVQSNGTALFSPEEPFLVCRENAQKVVIWDLVSQESKTVYLETPLSAAWDISQSGELLAAAHDSGDVTLLRMSDGKVVRRFTPGAMAIHALKFSPMGEELAASTDRGIEILAIHQTGDKQHTSVTRRFAEDVADCYYTLAFDGSGRLLAANANRIDVWQHSTGTKIGSLRNYVAHPNCLALNLPGTLAANANGTDTVWVWASEKAELISSNQ